MRDDIKQFCDDNWTKKGRRHCNIFKATKNEELRTLYIGASKIREIESTITILQTSAPIGQNNRSWMKIKDPAPIIFSKKEKWEKWKTDVEDYIERIGSGMKAVSKTVAKER